MLLPLSGPTCSQYIFQVIDQVLETIMSLLHTAQPGLLPHIFSITPLARVSGYVIGYASSTKQTPTDILILYPTSQICPPFATGWQVSSCNHHNIYITTLTCFSPPTRPLGKLPLPKCHYHHGQPAPNPPSGDRLVFAAITSLASASQTYSSSLRGHRVSFRGHHVTLNKSSLPLRFQKPLSKCSLSLFFMPLLPASPVSAPRLFPEQFWQV